MSYTTQQPAAQVQRTASSQTQSAQALPVGRQAFLAGWLAGSLIALASVWQLGALGLLSDHFQSLWPMSLLASAAANVLRLYLDQSPALELLLVWFVPISLAAAGVVCAVRPRAPRLHRLSARPT